MLGLEAFPWLAGSALYFTTVPAVAYGALSVAYIAFGVTTLAYVGFLSRLPVPAAQPIMGRWTTPVLVGLAVAYATVFLARTDRFIAGASAPAGVVVIENGPWLNVAVIVPAILVFLYGFVCAWQLWRRAPKGSATRAQGAAYAIAFAGRDLGWVGFLVFTFLLERPSQIVSWVGDAGMFVFLAALPYGILRHQLFDIDLRIKFAISKGTVVAVFTALVFVASELVEQLLGVDQLVPALLAAGLIALAMRPLVRVGERVADRIMPGVQDTEEYRLVRRGEVYRAAVESAVQDGTITENERRVLATLAEHLGLGPTEARRVEREALPSPKGVT